MTLPAHTREYRGSEWFARQLGISFDGVTTNGCRRARIRAAIVEQGLQDKYGAPFERLYGVPIEVTETAYAPQEVAR